MENYGCCIFLIYKSIITNNKLKNGEEIKVIKENNRSVSNRYINKWKGVPNKYLQISVNNNNVYNSPLKVSDNEFRETKELKMFIDGSNEMPEQFEALSAEKMYKQWLLLRLSDIKKSDWQIMDYVFFLFINQISCILNSYILYGPSSNSDTYYEQQKYNLYLNQLDKFTKKGGLYKNFYIHLFIYFY